MTRLFDTIFAHWSGLAWGGGGGGGWNGHGTFYSAHCRKEHQMQSKGGDKTHLREADMSASH